MAQMKFIVILVIVTILAFATLSSSSTLTTRATQAEIRKANADDAERLQKKFKSFKDDQKCTPDEICCLGNEFAKCATVFDKKGKLVNKFVRMPCVKGLKCAVLPLVLKRGTSITCTTEADRKARLDQARKNL